ncbi:alginate O-acetyltransferase AlgX-related protein [Deinococcus sp.]|uniref:alginate O-acetyltransferase AlgX-related protein n=1 Tax=Deinococcus sp. TaxID=47478 RepID=UPI003CC5AF60
MLKVGHILILATAYSSSALSQITQPATIADALTAVNKCGIDFDHKFGTRYWPNGVALYGAEYDTGWVGVFKDAAQTSTDEISLIRDLLVKNNIRLIVLPVPNRTSMLAPSLTGKLGIDLASINDAYKYFVNTLETKKIVTIDVLSPFLSSPNKTWAFAREAHWTEEGAEVVAKLIAKQLDTGSLDVRYEIQRETRSPTLSKFARDVFTNCNIRLPDITYNDYKFFLPSYRFYATGFSGIEDGSRVWAVGKKSALYFDSAGGKGNVKLEFSNPFDNQNININLNGKTIKSLQNIKSGDYSLDISAQFLKGANTISILPNNWNWGKTIFTKSDARELSLYFKTIKLSNPSVNLMNGLEPSISLPSESLLGDSPIKNILVGTSYSEESNGNNLKFANFIRLNSRSDVLNFSRGAGGISAAMRDFIESDQFKSNDSRSLIWEFPLNSINSDIGELKQIEAALAFKSCTKTESGSIITNSNRPFHADVPEVIRLQFADKSVNKLDIKVGSSTINLTNNDRQESKGIFYFKTLGGSSNPLQIHTESPKPAKITYCKI